MSKENSDSPVLDSKEIYSFTGGIVGGGNNNKRDLFRHALSESKMELLLNTHLGNDSLLSDVLINPKDLINTKPDVDPLKSTNRVKFYDSFIRVSKKSLRHIK